MEGVYKKSQDDRILLTPPSCIASETVQGIDNPVGVEEETSLENGTAHHTPDSDCTKSQSSLLAANGIPGESNGIPQKEDVSPNSIDEDDNPDCGWFKWRPNCAQCCNNIVGYTFFLSVFVIAQGMTVNGLVYVVITTLERRFGFPSRKSGFISSCYDFSVMVIIIFVTYLGEKAHKPVWLGIGAFIFGIGSLIFTLPHFLTGDYTYQNADFELCNISRTTNDDCQNDLSDDFNTYYGVFILAQVLHGIGASPLYTLGVTYIDENVSSAASGIYIGVFKSMAILGPAIGYIMGGLFLGIYTDIQKADEITDINSSSPTWVGAWWLGFIVAAFISFSIVFPFLGYPPSLPGGKKIFAQREVETQKGVEFEAKSGLQSIAQFPKALWILIKNLPFMFNSLSTASETFILVAVGVFGPKFLESQFNITSGEAAIIAGIIVTPSSFIGALFGGWVVKHFNLKYRGMMKFTLCVLICGFALQFIFFISCENIELAGITTPYYSSNETDNITTTCNVDCMCTDNFQPLCGVDDILYYSPCHAGCTEKDDLEYSSCRCIPSADNSSALSGSGIAGRCDKPCSSQLLFLIFTFLLITVTSMIAVPQITATLRCVSQSQRTFALGVQSVIYRCLGSIPAPIVFGSLIDKSCLIWEEECDESQTCWMYDNWDFSYYTLIMLQTAKIISILSVILALVTYRPAKEAPQASGSPQKISETFDDIPRVEDDEMDRPPQV